MFIVTAKLTKKKLVGAIVAAGLILIGVIILLASAGGRAAGVEAGPVKNIKTNDDRVAYLERLGWDVEAEPLEEEEVLIPGEWDATLKEYENLQQTQGFSLEKMKNKYVTRYIYLINNHPSGETQVYACLLIYKNRIVAGDVQSYALDGFMHGLAMPEG